MQPARYRKLQLLNLQENVPQLRAYSDSASHKLSQAFERCLTHARTGAATSGPEIHLATVESAGCSQTTTKDPHSVTCITILRAFGYTRAPKSNSTVAK